MEPTGFCECGCGNKTALAKNTCVAENRVRGRPLRFISGHNSRGANNPKWNGGAHLSRGYVLEKCEGHPRANNSGYVPKHILVAERALGRYLPARVHVHHVNGKKSDNRPENLVICEDNVYHQLLHRRERAYRATGDPTKRLCAFCHQYDLPENLFPEGIEKYHRACAAEDMRRRRRQP